MTDAASAAPRRRARGGGGAARRAERTGVKIETAKYIERNIPNFEVLSEEALQVIETNADIILEEVGVNFVDNPAALERWRAAGATVEGERVRIPRGLARELCKTAPSEFTQHARNPEKSVVVGGKNMVLAPVYGPPFVRDAKGGRRYATLDDFQKFVKLGYMSKWLHHSGGTVCEPTDVPVNKRHLDMLMAHMTLSDKPFMGSVTDPRRRPARTIWVFYSSDHVLPGFAYQGFNFSEHLIEHVDGRVISLAFWQIVQGLVHTCRIGNRRRRGENAARH